MSKSASTLSTKQAIDLIKGQEPRDRYQGYFSTHGNQPLTKETGEFGFEILNPSLRHEATLTSITYYDPILDEHQLTQVFLARILRTWGNRVTWGIGFYIPPAEIMVILEYRILDRYFNQDD